MIFWVAIHGCVGTCSSLTVKRKLFRYESKILFMLAQLHALHWASLSTAWPRLRSKLILITFSESKYFYNQSICSLSYSRSWSTLRILKQKVFLRVFFIFGLQHNNNYNPFNFEPGVVEFSCTLLHSSTFLKALFASFVGFSRILRIQFSTSNFFRMLGYFHCSFYLRLLKVTYSVRRQTNSFHSVFGKIFCKQCR